MFSHFSVVYKEVFMSKTCVQYCEKKLNCWGAVTKCMSRPFFHHLVSFFFFLLAFLIKIVNAIKIYYLLAV